jgi:Ligand-gated ion channel
MFEFVLLFEGHPDPPLSSSSRAIHFSALVSAVVVMATYSGSFTAFLTVRGDDVPFTTLDQLLKSSRFRPYTLVNSPEHNFFEVNIYDSIISIKIYCLEIKKRHEFVLHPAHIFLFQITCT